MAADTIAPIHADYKFCRTCERSLPRTSEFFVRDSSKSDGLHQRCKACVNAFRQKLPKSTSVEKPCTKCKKVLPNTLEFFFREEGDRLSGQCRDCRNAYMRARRVRDGDRLRARDRIYYAATREKSVARAMKHYRTDKGQASAKRARELRFERHWLNHRMAAAIRRVIGLGRGSSKWVEFLGYTVEDLEHHLVRQFTKGMTLEKLRSGEIEVDHILPLSFWGQVTGPEDPNFQAAWALSNLRPAWRFVNRSKAGKRLYLL